MPGLERFADGFRHETADGAFAVELHLALGGVDVDVDFGGVDFEEQTADRKPALHEGVVVTLDERGVETAVLDRAPVHEEMLVIAAAAGDARGTDPAPQPRVGGRGHFGGTQDVGGCDAGGF
jgi:hypothetical protein